MRACALSCRELAERRGDPAWIALCSTPSAAAARERAREVGAGARRLVASSRPGAGHLPSVPGYEVAGSVSRLGPSCSARLALQDPVVALVPVALAGGCSDYIVLEEHLLVAKPLLLSWEEAAASLQAGVRAYTALRSQVHVLRDETVLLFHGAHADQHIALQLALLIGAETFVTASSDRELDYLQTLLLRLSSLKDSGTAQMGELTVVDTRTTDLHHVVMAATGGLGVDYILEPCYDHLEACSPPTTQRILQLLAAQGAWITSRSIQLDPPAAKVLLLKSARLVFLFEQTWVLSGAQHGRYLHIVQDLMEQLAGGNVRVNVAQRLELEKISVAYAEVQRQPVGKVVIVL